LISAIHSPRKSKGQIMSLGAILPIVVILALIGVLGGACNPVASGVFHALFLSMKHSAA
jgi:hypothetical protein